MHIAGLHPSALAAVTHKYAPPLLHLRALLSPEGCSRGEADLNAAIQRVQAEDVALEQKAKGDWPKTSSSRGWSSNTGDVLSAGPPQEEEGLNSQSRSILPISPHPYRFGPGGTQGRDQMSHISIPGSIWGTSSSSQ